MTDAARARWAVAVLFGVNGASFATVLPRYPMLKQQLDLGNAAFGTVVAGAPLGALVAGAAGGLVTARWGSGRVAVVASAGLATNLVLVAVAPLLPVPVVAAVALAAALALGGAFDAVADVAENAQGLRVQRQLGRSVINGMHGAWSIGAVLGALVGSAAAGLDLPLGAHLGGWAVVALLVVAVAAPRLLPGPDPRVVPVPAVATRRIPWWPLLLLGLIAASGNLVEDAVSTWGAIYLGGLGAPAAVAGLGFVALQGTQIVGRLTGDFWVNRHGDRAVARAGGVCVLLGGLLLVVPATLPASFAGLGLAGLGVATLIPAAMRAADDVPDLPQGAGLAIVGTVLRVALLCSPPLVGLVADLASLRIGLLVVALAGAAVLALAGRLEGRPGAA